MIILHITSFYMLLTISLVAKRIGQLNQQLSFIKCPSQLTSNLCLLLWGFIPHPKRGFSFHYIFYMFYNKWKLMLPVVLLVL